MGKLGEALISITAGIIGLATIAVIVSNNAQTSQVLNAGGSAFAAVLKAATGPVFGGGVSSSLSLPSFGN